MVCRLVHTDKADGGDLNTHLRITSKSNRKRYRPYGRRGKVKNRSVLIPVQTSSPEALESVIAKTIPSLTKAEKAPAEHGRA